MSLNYCFVLNFVCSRCCLVCVSLCFHSVFIMCFITVYYVFLFYFACYYRGLILFILFLYNCMNLKRPKPHLLLTHPPLASCRAILSSTPLSPLAPAMQGLFTHYLKPLACLFPFYPMTCIATLSLTQKISRQLAIPV